MLKLVLYTAEECHLCELAEGVIIQALADSDYQLEEIDIASAPGLMDLYGMRVPVVKIEGETSDLGWPFDDRAFLAWLSSNRP